MWGLSVGDGGRVASLPPEGDAVGSVGLEPTYMTNFGMLYQLSYDPECERSRLYAQNLSSHPVPD